MPNLTNIVSPRKENTVSSDISVASKYEGNDLLIAVCCYLYFVSAAVLILRKGNSEFVQFHARQAFLILLFSLISFLFFPNPWKFLAEGGLFLLSIYSAYKAILGKRWGIPYLGSLEKYIDL